MKCYGCNGDNSDENVFCKACGAPLSLDAYIARQVTQELTASTKERDLIENASAIRVFERAYGWAKLVGGIATAMIALLIAGATYESINLRSSFKNAEAAIDNSRGAAQQDIFNTANEAKKQITTGSSASLSEIHEASRKANESSFEAQLSSKHEAALLSTQAASFRSEFQTQAASVSHDVVSARQQIQAASKLEPEMQGLQNQLRTAQNQIKEQQQILTSSEDFAKKLFSSHVQLLYLLPKDEKRKYALLDLPHQDGLPDRVVFCLRLLDTPVSGTLQLQLGQTVALIDSYTAWHNVLIAILQKGSEVQFVNGPIGVSYFPDHADKTKVEKLETIDGHILADGIPIPEAIWSPPTEPPPAETRTKAAPAQKQ